MVSSKAKTFGTVAGIILATTLVGCGATVPELPQTVGDSTTAANVLSTLDEAKQITLSKAFISIGDSWRVEADSVELGEVKGEFIQIIGDTYSLFSNEDILVASEAEQLALSGFQASTKYDYNNEETGTIERTFNPFLHQYEIKDLDGNVIGSASQNLNFVLDIEVKDATGEVEYRITKALISVTASLTVERKVDNPDVSALDAMWIVLIANEITESSGNDDNSSRR